MEQTIFTSIFFILITGISNALANEVHCTLPNQGKNLFMRCSMGGQTVPCSAVIKIGTSIQFQCSDFYMIAENSTSVIECKLDGKWTNSVPKCVPECGKVSSVVPLIVHGTVVPAGVFPWHVAMYHKNGDTWEFNCGGSLISETAVLTAAHCAWEVPAAELKVALGKQFREEKVPGENSHQMIQVAEVEMLDSYQDVNGNFNGDLAMLILNESVKLSQKVAPICIDWDLKYIEGMLTEGNTGMALGWGLTENDTFSNELRALRLPVMSDDKCIKQQQRDFKKYVTFTTFCAGYTNGTGVCNGDSGGGLAFLEPKSDTWFLQGLVSVSPRRRGTPYCDPTFYTVFTKVPMFTIWLKKMDLKVQAMQAKTSLMPGAVQPSSEKILASMTKT